MATTANTKSTARSSAAPKAAPVERTPAQQAQDIAERAVLIPVGAALVARDRVVETVVEAAKPFRTVETAQRQLERDLKRFERRGTTARNRVERQLKRTRTRVERELRTRRSRVQRVVKRNRTQVERQAKTLRRDITKQVDEAVTTVQERVNTLS